MLAAGLAALDGGRGDRAGGRRPATAAGRHGTGAGGPVGADGRASIGGHGEPDSRAVEPLAGVDATSRSRSRAVRVGLAPASARRRAWTRSSVEPRAIPAADARRALTRARILLAPAPTAPRPAADRRSGVTRREVVVDGWRVEVEVEPERRAVLRERARRGRAEAARGGPTEVRAIIPGVVVAVSVVAGDAVVAGQQLLVVEAMKMQNELRAPRDGIVARVAVGAGRTVEVGDLLLVLE